MNKMRKPLSILQKKSAFRKQMSVARKKHLMKSIKSHTQKTRMDRAEHRAKIKSMLMKRG